MSYHITKTEYEVMETLWKHEEGIRQPALLEIFHSEGKEWKRQTLNTFLTRLADRGMVKREHRIVKPAISREAFAHSRAQEVVDTMYDGKLSNLVLAFSETGGLSDEEADRLLELIQQRKK